MAEFKIDPSYNEVPQRIRDFKAKHPEGSLAPADPSQPYRIEVIDGKTYLAYTAAAYRSPDDPRPGIGCAWEPVPGKTSYTRDSELQNAETSAWGRAIVAALAADAKKVASAEDVSRGNALQEERVASRGLREQIAALAKERGVDVALWQQRFSREYGHATGQASSDELAEFLAMVRDEQPAATTTSPDAEEQIAAALSTPDVPKSAFVAAAAPEIGLTPHKLRETILAADSAPAVTHTLGMAARAGLADEMVADENGEACTINDLAIKRRKALR